MNNNEKGARPREGLRLAGAAKSDAGAGIGLGGDGVRADHGPIHVGAEFLARHRLPLRPSQALDRQAVLRRDAVRAVLLHRLVGDAEFGGKAGERHD